MKVTALGHAGLKVETARATVVVDPWFDPGGTFQAAWFQYPENAHVLERSLFRPTAIVISHEHPDHVDPWFLSRIPPSTPVIVPQYHSPVLRKKLEAAGARAIVEAVPWAPVEVADGTTVFFVPEQSPMNHDSAIVFQAGGRALLNLNDARLFPVQLRDIRREVGGTIDVFSFQGSGASWYPMCYRQEEQRKAALSHRKRLAKLGYAATAISILEPVVSLPFAGPACFLDPGLFLHNREMQDGIFPDQQQVADWLRGHGGWNSAVLLPGEGWDAEARAKVADSAWANFTFADRPTYLAAYAERKRSDVEAVLSRYPIPEQSLWDRFEQYFRRLLTLSPYFNDRIGMRVGFDILGPGGGEWSVDFRPGSHGVADKLGKCQYVYRFESRWLVPILDGRVPWEDFFLSLRFEAWRDPDVYNDHLLGLLKFADREALEAVEAFESSVDLHERITVHAGGPSYSVGRYCPHAGNDLLVAGEVLPGGILRCLAHHYEFDLRTGRCVNGVVGPLDTEPLEEHPPDTTPRKEAP